MPLILRLRFQHIRVKLCATMYMYKVALLRYVVLG